MRWDCPHCKHVQHEDAPGCFGMLFRVVASGLLLALWFLVQKNALDGGEAARYLAHRDGGAYSEWRERDLQTRQQAILKLIPEWLR